jgi:ABC-type transport system involved in multi-copper enzyme maturation permease subunit
VTQALAVARYTLLELTRRRLLLVIVAIGVVLMAGIAIAPHVLPGNKTDQDRIIVTLTALASVVPYAVTLCAFAVGMTVINHDLDSGAVVSIFAKPIPRAAYTAGKLVAAASLVLLITAIFTAGSMLDVAINNGGGVYAVVFWTCAALAANVVLLMLLVMALTVYLNNVIAAAIVLAFNFVAGYVLDLHAMVQNHVITDRVLEAIVNFAYWAVPHELSSNLQRETLMLQTANGNLRFRGENPLDRVPGASDAVDVVFWAAYLVAICVVLFWSVRRKQV